MLYHASGEHPSPCGLYDSLCTLRVGRSTVCLSFPITQHSVRVVGYSLPDRVFHPARNTRLGLAHTLVLLLLYTPHTAFLLMPSCLRTPEMVPAFKSFSPQSGIVVPLPVSGLNHFRCDPPPRRTISRHPTARNFLVNSL